MQISAIDIHHHYVPELMVGEAKQHGKALGIKGFDDNDGTFRISSMAVQDTVAAGLDGCGMAAADDAEG